MCKDMWTFVFLLISLSTAVYSLECYSCNSTIDVDCAKKPGKQLDVQECRTGDQCVEAIINGTTQRGCLSTIFPNKSCFNLCEKCNTSLCNVNIYPKNRLKCYQCSSSSCDNVQNNTAVFPAVCPIYKEKDRCYTNIISENLVWRGCEGTDLTAGTGCRNICLKCNYDGCNDEIAYTYHNCRQCSYLQSAPSPEYGCLRSLNESIDQCIPGETKSCFNKVLLGHKGKCFTYINEQTHVVNRGCSSAMCYYPNGNLTECYGEYCNSDCVDIMCNVCDTTTNVGCRNRTSYLRADKCNPGTNTCFSCEQGKHLWRGCGSDLPNPNENQVCYQCRDKNGCNSESIRSCYKCYSLNEKNCADWRNITNITVRNCTYPDEECVTTFVSKLNIVYTLRGCASEVIECTESDPFCDRCEGSLCNFGSKIWEVESRMRTYTKWLQSYQIQQNVSARLKFKFEIILINLFFWTINI